MPNNKFATHVDLNQNFILNAVVHPSGGTPTIGNSINGQIIFNSGSNGCLKYYDASNTGWFNASSRWEHIQGGSLQSVDLVMSTGSTLSYEANATINANRFAGLAYIDVVYGGTSRVTLPQHGVLVGNDTSAVFIEPSALCFNINNYRLGIAQIAPSAILHIGSGSSTAPLYIQPQTLLSTPLDNHFEYDGSGFYYTTNFGTRRTLATTAANLNDTFTGTLPLSKGGLGVTTLTDQGVLLASGTIVIAVTGAHSGEVLTWNGTRWTNSTSGYITSAPITSIRNRIVAQNSGTIPLTLYGASGQTVSLFDAVNYQGTPQVRIDHNGVLRPYKSIICTGVSYFGGGTTFFTWATGSIAVSDCGVLNSIGAVGNTLLGINFRESSNMLEFRDSIATTRMTIGTTSGVVIQGNRFRISSTSGWFTNGTASGTYLGVGNGSGNHVFLPRVNGTLAVLSDLSNTGNLPTGIVYFTGGVASGNVPTWNGSGWVGTTPSGGSPGGPGGSGITSINSLTALAQTLVVGSAGSDFNIDSTTSTHTFNIPTATGNTRGLLSSGDWSSFANKPSKYAFTLATGSKIYNVIHNLNTRDCAVYVYENSGSYNQVIPTISHTNATGLTITFGTSTIIEHRVIIHG